MRGVSRDILTTKSVICTSSSPELAYSGQQNGPWATPSLGGYIRLFFLLLRSWGWNPGLIAHQANTEPHPHPISWSLAHFLLAGQPASRCQHGLLAGRKRLVWKRLHAGCSPACTFLCTRPFDIRTSVAPLESAGTRSQVEAVVRGLHQGFLDAPGV